MTSFETNCPRGEAPTVLQHPYPRKALSQVCLSALLLAADLSATEMRSVDTTRLVAMLSSLFSYLSKGHNPWHADILLQASHPCLTPESPSSPWPLDL